MDAADGCTGAIANQLRAIALGGRPRTRFRGALPRESRATAGSAATMKAPRRA
ncbi:hypothetical protein [Demequina soli]|uniref:hypothetical protein n=1 Tax=Demequina soli TaxID=1638987 RepID=UPI0012E06731|nr:hypothetical protein [Demequina soli]